MTARPVKHHPPHLACMSGATHSTRFEWAHDDGSPELVLSELYRLKEIDAPLRHLTDDRIVGSTMHR